MFFCYDFSIIRGKKRKEILFGRRVFVKAFITVLGKDKPGIIAKITGLLADREVNVEDISQTIMQGNFTMIMLVSLEKAEVTISALSEAFDKLGKEIGVEIFVRSDKIYDAMHRV